MVPVRESRVTARVALAPEQGQRKAGDDVPDAPPGGDDGHAAQAVEQVEDQDKAQAGVLDAHLEGDGTAVALGVVPLLFSLAILLMPLGRALLRPMREARAAKERARLSVVRVVVNNAKDANSVSERALTTSWKSAAGSYP